jgi:hypothetical protein
MAPKTIVTQEPVTLDGYQAVMKPSKYGYSLQTVFTDDLIEQLEADRTEVLKWCESKLKNPKRATLKPEPWEEVAEGKYKVKFSWNEETTPTVVDSEGTIINNTDLPVYSGSIVKLAFYQKPYILKDQVTYGTSLKLKGIQIISLSSGAGISDSGDLTKEDVVSIFGKTKGFKVDEPNVTVSADAADDDDF